MSIATQHPTTGSLSRSLPSSSSASHLAFDSRTPKPSRGVRGTHFLPSPSNYTNPTFSTRPHLRHYSSPLQPTREMPHLISSLAPRRVENTSRTEGSFDHETFEWEIAGIHTLAKHVEGIQTGGGLWQLEGEMDNPEDLPDPLSRGWTSCKGMYRFDLARTIPPPLRPTDTVNDMAEALGTEEEAPDLSPTLTLYITALGYDGQALDMSFTAGIFVGIIPAQINVGQHFAETKYIWSHRDEKDFDSDSDYYEVTLPLLSDLLKHDSVKKQDAFVICLWMGPRWDIKPGFKLPDPMTISTMNGLRRLLDRETGDVKFICLEHKPQVDEDGCQPEDDAEGKRPTAFSRKRILYAHSDILEEKCEYFKDMLNGGFSESKRYTTIYVETESFATLYWVLRFLYTNELMFADDEDVRETMDHLRLDPSEVNRLLRGGAGGGGNYLGAAEWAYHRLPLDGEVEMASLLDDLDTKTVRSVSSAGTGISGRGLRKVSTEEQSKVPDVRPRSTSVSKAATGSPSKIPTPRAASTAAPTAVPTGHAAQTLDGIATLPSSASASGGSKPLASNTSSRPVRSPSALAPASVSSPTKARSEASTRRPQPRAAPAAHNPPVSQPSPAQGSVTSPKSQPKPTLGARNPYPPSRLQPEPDPHVHPTAEPAPANALEVYMLANRYRLEVLKELAKEHILQKMTNENCVPMAFATYHYDLHDEVLDFVAANWTQVKRSETFLRCIKEVREDVWGENGPMVLHNIFKRL